MRHVIRISFITVLLFASAFSGGLHADLDNNQVINHEIARRIETLKEENGYSSEDFNACQITWTVKKLEKTDPYSEFQPQEITFHYESQEALKLINNLDGDAQSIEGLGLNCLEYNNYVYLFLDTIDYETRHKFDLSDLSYVIYSSDQGASWSDLISLHQFSVKAKFILPHDKFWSYTKVFGNKNGHVLSIFNLRDETTYLFDAEFNILKTVSVYNRLSNYDYPSDFNWHENTIYLARGSCEKVKGRLRCPARTYVETSQDFGKTWKKEKFPFIDKSFFLTLNDSFYQFYSQSCSDSWLGLFPAINRKYKCGYIKTRKLGKDGKWEKPKILLRTAVKFMGIYKDTQPILVWQDFRFHKGRLCGYIPLIGCIDSGPVQGPQVIYAGELDPSTWKLKESIIKYVN